MKTVFEGNQRDYTYRNYENCDAHNESIVQSLFNGSKFSNCDFSNCDFSRCDYEGMSISKTNTYDCYYINADIKSVVWEKCILRDCVFSDAYFSNNIFIECQFINCSFSKAIFINNKLINCEFFNCNLEQSTFSLSLFQNCTFKSMSLGNCSFYKQILWECNYKDVSINIDSLGQVYGLNQKIIKDVSYIFLGEKYGNILEFGIDKLADIFRSKKWIFEEIFLKHNCGTISNFDLLTECADYFVESFDNNKIIKQDEIDFLLFVIDFLKEKHQLPLYPLIYTYQVLYEKINNSTNLNQLHITSIKLFMNRIFIIIHEMMEEYYESVSIYENNKEETIKIHYKNTDAIYFDSIINELDTTFELNMVSPAKLVEIQSGSYIEIVVALITGIMALQFVLYGISGVLLQLIDIKSKIKVLTAKNPPSNLMALTKQGKQIRPDVCELIVKRIKEKKTLKMFAKYASKLKDVEFISDEVDL